MADTGVRPGGDVPREGRPSGPPSVPSSASSPVSSSAPASQAPVSASPPATRPPYIPQFTAATQLILKRMKGEPSSLSSALSAASVVAGNIKPSTYEDVKRRLVMGMNTSTSMTMHMPTTASPSPGLAMPSSTRPVPSAKAAAGMSAIRKISSGLTISGKPALPKPPAVRTLSTESKVKKPKTTVTSKAASSRRKRTKGHDGEESESSDPVDASEAEASSVAESATALTTTKSGRQVQKPSTYNPAAVEAATRKRGHYGKRTAEQALCKKCTRMHSPASNQMVFCDGCNDGWHQTCHDPWIGDDVVNDTQRAWFCSSCVEKRNRTNAAKRQKVEAKPPSALPLREGWGSKTPQQRRAYLMTLSNQDLVGMLMNALEIHPDLPIFPPASDVSGARQPRSLFAGPTVEGLFPRADANPTGQMNFVRKAANGTVRSSSSGPVKGKGGKSQKDKEDSQERVDGEDEEYDPLAPLWPKPGHGLYRRLPPDSEDAEHMVDDDDYEAFSVIVYDERGRKVEENGMKV